jgi:arginine exporter protein ArgO
VDERVERRTGDTGRSDLQKAAMVFGIVFLAVGIIGFIPGLTTEYSRLTTFDGEGAKVLGLFGVNWLENGAHLLFGLAGLAMARTQDAARAYFIGGGIIYLILWIYGLVIDLDSSANFLGLNTAGNWLHFVLGVVMLGVGLFLGRRATSPDGRADIA